MRVTLSKAFFNLEFQGGKAIDQHRYIWQIKTSVNPIPPLCTKTHLSHDRFKKEQFSESNIFLKFTIRKNIFLSNNFFPRDNFIYRKRPIYNLTTFHKCHWTSLTIEEMTIARYFTKILAIILYWHQIRLISLKSFRLRGSSI